MNQAKEIPLLHVIAKMDFTNPHHSNFVKLAIYNA